MWTNTCYSDLFLTSNNKISMKSESLYIYIYNFIKKMSIYLIVYYFIILLIHNYHLIYDYYWIINLNQYVNIVYLLFNMWLL